MSVFQGNGLGDIINALHYGYEAQLSAEIAGAEGDALLALLSQHNLSMAPEMATEVGNMLNDLLTRGGLDSMMWTISLIICALFFGGAMEACGFLETIVGAMMSRIKTVGGTMGAVVVSCLISNLFLGDQYLSLIVPGRMFKKTFEEKGPPTHVIEGAGRLWHAHVSVGTWNTCGAFQSGALASQP